MSKNKSVFSYDGIKRVTEIAFNGSLPENWDSEKLADSHHVSPIGLLSYDVDSIKKYIFASSDFKAIMGASQLVSDFDSEAEKIFKKFNFHVVMCTGGTGLCIVPNNISVQIEEELQASFKENVPGGNLTVSFVPLFPFELLYGFKNTFKELKTLQELFNLKVKDLSETQNKFSSVFSFIASKMREKKSSKPPVYARLTPEVKNCDLCNQFPASNFDDRYDEVYYCDVCASKIDAGSIKIDSNNFSNQLVKITSKDIDPKWMGVIYTDGNNLGKLYSKISDEEEYIAKSKKIDDTVRNAVKWVVNKYHLEGKYAAPILGGDDIMLIVPADITFNVFRDLAGKLNDGFNKEITFCSGILFAKPNLPLKMIFEAAESLLKSAKKKFYEVYKKSNTEDNYVAFRLLMDNNINAVAKETIYKEEFGNEYVETFEKLGNGMTLKEFDELIKVAVSIKNSDVLKNMPLRFASYMNDHPTVANLNMNYFFAKNYQNKLSKSNPTSFDFKNFMDKIFVCDKCDKNTLTYSSGIFSLIDMIKMLEEEKK